MYELNHDVLIAQLRTLEPAQHQVRDANDRITPDTKAKTRMCKAARALLGWSQEVLAYHAGCTPLTVSNFERAIGNARLSTHWSIHRAFENAGVMFFEDDDEGGIGVRLTV